MTNNRPDGILNHSIGKQAAYILSGILLVLSPWILLFISVLLAGGSIEISFPLWSDEMGYWHEVASLNAAGLDFGYYTFDEQLPRYLSFGAHGFGTISAYLPYAKIFGWNYHSLVLANNLYVSFAFLLLILITKPSVKKLLLITTCYLTYMPILLYCFTSMSELLNYASLIVYFSLLYTYIQAKQHRNLLFVILLTFTIYISFIRVIYIILLLPVLLEKYKISGLNRQFLTISGIWIILSAAIYFLNSLFVAPYPYSFLAELSSYPSVFKALYELQKHFFQSIGKFFSFKHDTLLQILQRYFIFISLIILLLKSGIIRSKLKKWNFPFFISFFILFLTLLINFAVYDIFDWRDYRVFAPILFGLFIFIVLAESNTRLIKYAISINLIILAVFAFILPASDREGVYTKDRYRQIESIDDLKAVRYDPDAKSKFDNTIILKGFIFTGFDSDIILNVPAGIGITTCFGEITDRLQSRYIYSSQEYPLKTYRIVRSSSYGVLYRKIED